MNNNDVLAVVGNREITRGAVEALLRSLNPQTAAQFQSESGMKKLVNELASQELFYLDAIEKGMDREDEFVSEVENMKVNLLKQYAVSRLMSDITVSEDDIVDFYNSNKDTFKSALSVKASHILVETLEKAEEALDKIKKGLPFEDAAELYSTCPSKERGGDLGYFSKGRMVPEFENAAFKMERNQISEPIKTQFGYHLIKVYSKKGGTAKTLDEARSQISQQLLSDKQQSTYQRKIDELKGKYEIKINI